MKTLEMEIAIMKYFGIRSNMIVPNVSWGMSFKTRFGYQLLHECDLLVLSNSNYATEIEIKVSKGDLINDKNKSHNHDHEFVARLFYAVPEKLEQIALEVIPERAGLLVVRKYDINVRGKNIVRYNVRQVKAATRIKSPSKWSDSDRYNLARLGVMRILGLKDKVLKLQTKIKQSTI